MTLAARLSTAASRRSGGSTEEKCVNGNENNKQNAFGSKFKEGTRRKHCTGTNVLVCLFLSLTGLIVFLHVSLYRRHHSHINSIALTQNRREELQVLTRKRTGAGCFSSFECIKDQATSLSRVYPDRAATD